MNIKINTEGYDTSTRIISTAFAEINDQGEMILSVDGVDLFRIPFTLVPNILGIILSNTFRQWTERISSYQIVYAPNVIEILLTQKENNQVFVSLVNLVNQLPFISVEEFKEFVRVRDNLTNLYFGHLFHDNILNTNNIIVLSRKLQTDLFEERVEEELFELSRLFKMTIYTGNDTLLFYYKPYHQNSVPRLSGKAAEFNNRLIDFYRRIRG